MHERTIWVKIPYDIEIIRSYGEMVLYMHELYVTVILIDWKYGTFVLILINDL